MSAKNYKFNIKYFNNLLYAVFILSGSEIKKIYYCLFQYKLLSGYYFREI